MTKKAVRFWKLIDMRAKASCAKKTVNAQELDDAHVSDGVKVIEIVLMNQKVKYFGETSTDKCSTFMLNFYNKQLKAEKTIHMRSDTINPGLTNICLMSHRSLRRG